MPSKSNFQNVDSAFLHVDVFVMFSDTRVNCELPEFALVPKLYALVA